MKITRFLLTICAFILVATAAVAATLHVRVTEVQSGNTLVVSNTSRALKVRLKAIAPPEAGQPFSDVAREHLKTLVLDKAVALDYTNLSDGYFEGKISLDGIDVGSQMLRDGAAWYDPSQARSLSQADRELYAACEKAARDEKRGLWSDAAAVAPWEFLQAKKTETAKQEETARKSKRLNFSAHQEKEARKAATNRVLSNKHFGRGDVQPGDIAGNPTIRLLDPKATPGEWIPYRSDSPRFSIRVPWNSYAFEFPLLTDDLKIVNLVVGSLWLCARALRGSGRAFVGAGLLAGIATLSRNDGLLVLAALGLVFVWDRWRSWRSADGRVPVISVAAAVGCLAVFALVMAPWWARQLAVFGSLSPSTASGKVLFIRTIGEWNSITTPATLEHLLGMGVGPFLATRVGGLVAATMIYITLVAGVLLAPLMVIGGWGRRRSRDFRPFFIYAGLLFAFSALVSAVHVPGGTFIHSAIALAPFSYILALEGVRLAVGWVAARRSAWDVERADRVFSAAVVGFAVLCAVAGSLFVHAVWEDRRVAALAVAQTLDAADSPATDRVMSIDAASTKYWTGHGGVVLVNDSLETIRDVARAYDIRWLVIDTDDTVPAAGAITAGDRPDWVGPPLDTGVEGVTVYPIEFEP